MNALTWFSRNSIGRWYIIIGIFNPSLLLKADRIGVIDFPWNFWDCLTIFAERVLICVLIIQFTLLSFFGLDNIFNHCFLRLNFSCINYFSTVVLWRWNFCSNNNLKKFNKHFLNSIVNLRKQKYSSFSLKFKNL